MQNISNSSNNVACGRMYHPLHNVSLPSVEDLRSRCSGIQSEEVLNIACKFAAARCRDFNNAEIALGKFGANPYIGDPVKLRQRPGLTLDQVDIVRALLATQPVYLEEALFGTVKDYIAASDSFRESSNYWKSLIGDCIGEVSPRAVATRWSRRWALLFLTNPDQTIDLNIWILSVIDVIPPSFSNLSCSGLITDIESQTKMQVGFYRFIKSLPGPKQLTFPTSPPAYFDRHGLLPQVNDLLEKSCGIFLVGPERESLRSLLRAITSEVSYCPEYKALDKFHGSGGSCFSPESFSSRVHANHRSAVFALNGNVPAGVGGPAWCLDPEEGVQGRLALETVGFFRWLMDQSTTSTVRYVIVMTDEEFLALAKMVPDVRRFIRLYVPCREKRDLVPTLLAELPAVHDRHGQDVPFGLLLNFLYQTDIVSPELLADYQPELFGDIVDVREPNLGLLHVSPFRKLHDTPFDRLNASGVSIRAKERLVRKMIAESEKFFVEYIGDAANLDDLLDLYKSVTDLKAPVSSTRTASTSLTAGSGKSTGTAPSVSEARRDKSTCSSASQPTVCSYTEVVRSLPVPTSAQTARFASFVAESHSWYKKLPVFPSTPFFFFLDPTAGMKFLANQDGTDGGHFVDDEGNGIHYSEMSTELYRERFGYWNYHVDAGGGLLDRFKRNVKGERNCDEVFPELYVRDVAGNRIAAPSPEMMLQGMAKLSAFVHGDSPLHLWSRDIEKLKEQTPFTFALTLERAPLELSDPLRQVWAFLNTPGWYPVSNFKLLSSYEPIVNDLMTDPSAPSTWHDEDRLLEKSKELGGEYLFEQVLFAVEILRTTESRRRAMDFHRGSSPADKVKNLLDRLVLERMQQVQSMKDAMNRFVDEVSPAGQRLQAPGQNLS